MRHVMGLAGRCAALCAVLAGAACIGGSAEITPSQLDADGFQGGAGGIGAGTGGGLIPVGSGNGNATGGSAGSGNGTTTVGSGGATGGGATVSPGQASRGATVPYYEYEAEAASTNGQVLAPTRIFGEMANEASGRSAVKLTAVGQYVQFTLEQPTNSIVVRYSIPDSPSGGGQTATLGLYIGNKRTDLTLTSRYSWTYGDADAQGQGSESPGAGTPHHYYDEVHTLFDEVPAGTVIKLQRDSQDAAAFYVVDLVDFELVGAPLPQPANSLSILDFGATPNDASDDRAAINRTIAAAVAQNKSVWIPKGVFEMGSFDGSVSASTTPKINATGVSIQGAGMWHSVLHGFGAQIVVSGNNNTFANFALFGDVVYRDDTKGWQGLDGPAGTGSSLTNVWIEHQTAGWWVGKGAFVGQVVSPLTDGLVVRGLRARNLYADGINFANATSNSVVEQSTFRGTGDDAIATWSFAADGPTPCKNNTFRFNTVQAVWRANCIALYGGDSLIIEDNLCSDTSNYPGLLVSTTFSAIAFSGNTKISRNTLTRAGGPHYGQQFGALRFFADTAAVSNIAVSDIAIDSPTFSGVHFGGSQNMSNITLDNIKVTDYGTLGIWVSSETRGGATLSNVSVQGSSNKGLQSDTSSFTLTRGSGLTGF